MAKKKKERFGQAVRVLRIREMLDAHRFVTVAQLQQDFGVSRGTVYNDFRVLEEAGVPLFSEPGPEGEARWQIPQAARRQTITLAKGQVLPLAFAKASLSFLEGTELHGQLAAVLSRLALALPPLTKRYLGELDRKIAVIYHGPKCYADKVDVLDDVLTGLLYDQCVEVSYRSPGRRARVHVIEPLTLMLHREALYLVARIRGKERVATFAVERIARSTWLKGETFCYPCDYDPHDFIDGAFGLIGGEREEVEVLLDAEQAQYVKERRWHASQDFSKADDGRTRMTLSVSGTFGVLRWMLGHIDRAEVVAPRALRKQVRDAAKRAWQRHR